jgi:hypothetical protein
MKTIARICLYTRSSRASGNPATFIARPLGPRVRGDDVDPG